MQSSEVILPKMTKFEFEERNFFPMQYRPNKAPEPTTTSGTVAAEPLGVPAAVVAHL
jgi:hypothetical protein